MADFDKEKLENLLNADKWEEASEMIKAFLSEDEEGVDSAELKSAMALVYLDVMLKINEAYEASLQSAINQIKDLKKSAREARESAGLKHVGAKIDGLNS